MIASVSSSILHGNIQAPASKSAMQRACALALLNNGITIIQNPGTAADDKAAISIIQALGAKIQFYENCLEVISTGNICTPAMIDCGESGLSCRMFSIIASMGNEAVVVNGKGTLLNRPMQFLWDVLPGLGVRIYAEQEKLPYTIQGPLQVKDIEIDAATSSQYLTGLLFAFAKSAKKQVSITVNNLVSKPYIDLSIEMLQHFGYKVAKSAERKFVISPVEQSEKKIEYVVESDWSNTAFLLVAGAIAGNICIEGLTMSSVQGDRKIIEVLKMAGASLSITKDTITVSNQEKLTTFQFDATDCPDLFPPLAALAVHCNGISVIKGVHRLADKESDRAKALINIFTTLGIRIFIKDDSLFIDGGSLKAGRVHVYHDHRIAMAVAVAALKASGEITIEGAEAVDKSYPSFYNDLKMLGATVSLL